MRLLVIGMYLNRQLFGRENPFDQQGQRIIVRRFIPHLPNMARFGFAEDTRHIVASPWLFDQMLVQFHAQSMTRL